MTYTLHGSTLSGLLAATLSAGALAADHREAPLINQDQTADIGDFYAFLDPEVPDNMVFVITVNGFSVPSENNTYNFSPDVRYRVLIDNTGDAIADASINTEFSPLSPQGQGFRTTLPDGTVVAGPVTLPTLAPEPNPAIIVEENGVRVFAGQRDDPFFFDTVGFARFRAGTGTFSGDDGFAGENVSALVISVPLRMIDGGSDQLQLWSTTERNLYTRRTVVRNEVQQHFGQFMQLDRMGNPAVNAALVPASLKDLFNAGKPVNDAVDFAPAIVSTLISLGTNDENIGIIASVGVPDTLKFDQNFPSVYPNGRGLEDDVVDTILFFIFNQTDVSDGVDGNDKAFDTSFPFLAAPHQPD